MVEGVCFAGASVMSILDKYKTKKTDRIESRYKCDRKCFAVSGRKENGIGVENGFCRSKDSKMGFDQRSVSRIDLKRKKTAEGVKRSEGVTICVGYENKKDR